jgi:hypothetical protein
MRFRLWADLVQALYNFLYYIFEESKFGIKPPAGPKPERSSPEDPFIFFSGKPFCYHEAASP